MNVANATNNAAMANRREGRQTEMRNQILISDENSCASNRYTKLLGLPVSYTKQTIGHLYNRYKIACCRALFFGRFPHGLFTLAASRPALCHSAAKRNSERMNPVPKSSRRAKHAERK